MAVFSTLSGSLLIGSPLVVSVQAAAFQNATAFHRVVLRVHTLFQGQSNTITLSSPAENGENLLFDLSSSLCSAADSYKYSVIPPTAPDAYPVVGFWLEAYDEYMADGVLSQAQVATLFSEEDPMQALMGKFSDLERLLSNPNGRSIQYFTRKPRTLPEVVMVGEQMVCPLPFDAPVFLNDVVVGPSVAVVDVEEEGMQTINGRQVYALPAGQRDRYQFRFVNGLGCLESVSLSSLRATEMNCTADTYIRAVQETFGTFSRAVVVKRNDYETWKMSTPPLDEAWQSWFLHEFLMTRYCWVKVGEHWIPCHIIPDETVSGINRQDNSLLTVTFSVRLDINGSPLSALAV